MKRPFFGILLFFILVVPVVTTFVALHLQKKQVKREVKRKMIAAIDKAELVLLKFTDREKQAQLKWEHEKEFEYKDEMFDIVESEFKGDTSYYWCWWDHEETKLNRQLNELVSSAMGDNPKNQENQIRLYDFFKALYFSEFYKVGTISIREVDLKYFYPQHFYHSMCNAPLVPPPKIA
ncbi:MAG: hypothetical protein IPO86_01125 [Saprospiraceae bacterium]|nr:hypothetical protein [Saprospiraceae bacterium]